MQRSLFEDMQASDLHQPVLPQADVSSHFFLTDIVEDKESCLFILVWLLENYGYIYYDTEDDEYIIEVECVLKQHNIAYNKGRLNRLFLQYDRLNG